VIGAMKELMQGAIVHSVRTAHPRGRSRGRSRRVNSMPSG
jgi:hypothetical protein